MARTEVTRFIKRPPPDVFAYLTDLERFPEWSSSVIEAKDVRNPTATHEGRCTLSSKFLGKHFDLPFRAVALLDPLTLLLETTGGPIAHTWRYAFKAQGAGTELTITVDGDPGTFFRLTAPVVMQILNRQMQADTLAIKEYLELISPATALVRKAQLSQPATDL